MKRSIETSRKFKAPSGAVYEFERHETVLFPYGNKSGVTVTKNGEFYTTFDTRYDKSVMKDFDTWCRQMISYMFSIAYEDQWKEDT